MTDKSNQDEGNNVPLIDNTLIVDISDALSEKDKVKFTVHTRTTMKNFQKSEFLVVRQHEEFIWLHDRYEEDPKYAGYIIPPPPPRPNFDASREKLQRLGEGEGTMTKEEFTKMKQELEAEYLATFKKTVAMHEVFLTRLASHSIFRRLYPYDPHINVTYYPIGNGQLTNAGKRRLYLLGKALKKRYGNFLGTFTVDTVDARSTDYRRTKMSLQLVLASLFPPENELIWEKHLKWQPVPFTYWPIEKDHVLGEAYENCPRYLKLYYDYMETLDRRNLYGNYSDVAQYLERHAGINATTREMAEIYFTLRVELENGLELPDWTRQVYPQVLHQLAHLEYHVATATSEMKRLSSGFLLNKIITDTELKMQNLLPQNRKMFLYSGHEYNIAFLMKLLGIYYPHIPPYGAYILVEIHNVKGVRNVRIFYQDYTMGKPKRMRLPKCQRFCRFERLVKLYQKYLPESEEECERVEE